MSSAARRMDDTLRASLPITSVLFFVLLAMLPWPWQTARTLFYPCPMLAVCYWIVYRPDLFTMRWSFLLGLMQDLLLGFPLGITALVWLTLDFVLRPRQRLILNQPFMQIWLVFSLVLLGATALQVGLLRFVTGQPVDIAALTLSLLPSLLLFPVLARLLHVVQQMVPAR